MTTPIPCSPPFRKEDRTRDHCYIEVDGQLKEASWRYERGQAFPQDFTDTSPELDILIHDQQLSDAMSDLWKISTLMGYGSDAVVRLQGESAYPVIKLAHPKPECRQRIQKEFEVMRRLSHLGFVAKISPEPLKDEEGIFGFRLERLHKMTKEETTSRKGEIGTLVEQLHQTGYCHGDIHFCNIMKRGNEELALIDFAYAGALGELVPDHVPKYMHPTRVYQVEVDLERIGGGRFI